MKNTFKYIAAIAAFSAAALASGITVSAQNLDDGKYKEENGIAYAKRAITNTDGTYTIDLETFVTGEVEQTFESTPADVVLVLDVSGSMSETITSYTYTEANVTSLTYNNNSGQTNYYYNYQGGYYQVTVGRAGQGGNQGANRRYYLSFTADRTYYINLSGAVVTEEPREVTGQNGASTNLLPSNIMLYTRQASTTMTRLDALKSAVRAFMSQINKNDTIDPQTKEVRSERLGNRIAIVAFSGAQYAGQSNHDNSIKLNTGWIDLGPKNDITDSTGLNSLKTNLGTLSANGGTHVEYGMQDALALIQDSEASIRTVVLFTDGIPGTGTWGQEETTNSANGAINYSSQINAITIGTGENATTPKIFAVGLFSTKPVQGTNTYNYMNYVSSNYPDATSMTDEGSGQKSNDFYKDASGGSADDLEAIFVAIAHASGGSGNTDVSGGSSVTVDIVSSSFSVPQGYASHPEDAITVLVAPCNSIKNIDGKEYLQFGEAKAPSEYGLPDITPSINEADNKVSTTGFDYSANWCGPDPTSTSAVHNYAYHGYKQIIRFIINVKDDAVGGPAVETNDPNSGIYLEGSDEPLIKFNRPNVKLPVQIWIQKQGLQGDDSAVFTIRRIKYRGTFETDENGDYILDANGNPIRIDYSKIPKAEWDTFTKVVVNSKDLDANGMVKIVGLDPDYVYKLEEDAWAYGYTYQDGGIQYTIGDNVDNPFIFVNVPNDTKFDEATIRNVFKEKTASN